MREILGEWCLIDRRAKKVRVDLYMSFAYGGKFRDYVGYEGYYKFVKEDFIRVQNRNFDYLKIDKLEENFLTITFIKGGKKGDTLEFLKKVPLENPTKGELEKLLVNSTWEDLNASRSSLTFQKDGILIVQGSFAGVRDIEGGWKAINGESVWISVKPGKRMRVGVKFDGVLLILEGDQFTKKYVKRIQ